jgi:hypothetical protein
MCRPCLRPFATQRQTAIRVTHTVQRENQVKRLDAAECCGGRRRGEAAGARAPLSRVRAQQPAHGLRLWQRPAGGPPRKRPGGVGQQREGGGLLCALPAPPTYWAPPPYGERAHQGPALIDWTSFCRWAIWVNAPSGLGRLHSQRLHSVRRLRARQRSCPAMCAHCVPIARRRLTWQRRHRNGSGPARDGSIDGGGGFGGEPGPPAARVKEPLGQSAVVNHKNQNLIAG